MQSSVLGSYLKVSRHIEAVDLSSTPGPLGFPPRQSARLCPAHGCRGSRIDREVALWHRIVQEVCVTEYSHCVGPAGTASSSSDCINIPVIGGSVVVFAAGVIGVSRDVVTLPLLLLSVNQQSFAEKTVFSKVLSRFGVVFAFAFALLDLVFVFLVFVA